MEWQQWARQWTRLVRQEGELAGAADPPAAAVAGAAAPREPGRRQQRGGTVTDPALQQLRTQLAKQLSSLEALQAAPVGHPQTRRRQQHCEAALAALQAASAAQLQELQQLEAELAAEHQAAAQRVQEVLQAAATQDALPQLQPQVQATAPAAVAVSPAATGDASAPGASARAGGRGQARQDLPPEVTAHDAFLQRHGPAGGWHPDDHSEFERILRAARGNYSHCQRLCGEELGLLHSAEDIAQHVRWHEELQQLALRKRLAVQRWRMRRQAERLAALEEQQAQAEAAARLAQGEGEAAAARKQAREKERQRAELADWKREREEQRAEEQRRREAEALEQRRREVQARQQRQQENRQALEQRRQQQQHQAGGKQVHCAPSAEHSGTSISTSTSSSGSADPTARLRLQERNQQLLARRAAQVQARALQRTQQAERQEALQRRASEQFAGAAERDPRRLLQATSATAVRQLAALGEERSAKDSGFIRHLPRRATPTWCRGARLQ